MACQSDDAGSTMKPSIFCCINISNWLFPDIIFFFIVSRTRNPLSQLLPGPHILAPAGGFSDAKQLAYFNMCISFYGIQVKNCLVTRRKFPDQVCKFPG